MKVGWAAGKGGGIANKKAGTRVLAPLSAKPPGKYLQLLLLCVDSMPKSFRAGCVTVFLGKLPYLVNEEILREHFGKCGEINDVRFVEKDGVFKGYAFECKQIFFLFFLLKFFGYCSCAFIEFASTDATDKAVKLNGSNLTAGEESSAIRVDYAASGARKNEE